MIIQRLNILLPLALWLMLLCPCVVIAETDLPSPLLLTENQLRYDLNLHLKHFEDEAGQLSISDIYSDRLEMPWQEMSEVGPNIGFSRSVHWFYVEIDTLASNNFWYLNIDSAQIRELDVYLIRDDVVSEVYLAGDRFEFSARMLEYRSFLFPLDVFEKQSLVVMIRLESPYPIRVPALIVERNSFLQDAIEKEFAYGLLFGFLLVMAAYSTLVFVLSREYSYMFYVCLTISTASYMAAEQGFLFQYLWPSTMFFQHNAVGFFGGCCMLFSCLFMLEFLQIRIQQRGLYVVLTAVVFYSFIAIVSSGVVDPYYLQQMNSIMVLFAVPIIFAAGFWGWRSKQQGVGYFLAGMAVYLSGVVCMIVTDKGLLPNLFVTRYSMECATMLAFALFTVALTDNYNRQRSARGVMDEREKAAEAKELDDKEFALALERVSNERLAKNVKERSERLHQALAELALANHKLEEISTIDPVTGLKNRVSFMDKLKDEWERSYREKTPVALLLISIEKVEPIDDSYEDGDGAVDESLRAIGEVLSSLVTRPGDMLARIDEALFAAVLPNTTVEGVDHLVREVDRVLVAEPLDLGACCITVSVAYGRAVTVPQQSSGSDSLFSQAYMELDEKA